MNDIKRKLDLIIQKLDGALSPEQTEETRKALEEISNSIKESDEVDFKAIIDSSQDGIYIVDKNCKICYINPAYTQYTSVKPEDVLGKKSYDLVSDGIFRKVATPEVIQKKRTQVLLGYVRTVGKRNIYGYSIVRPVFDGNGDVRYAVVTLYDPEQLKKRYLEFEKSSEISEPIYVKKNASAKQGDPIIGSSQALKNAYDTAKRVSSTDATVLIYGESGVGKEGMADFICQNSPRMSQPFVKVNCAAIPASLLESELFGYERGSFTGASSKGKIGLFEQANNGTILLDEIGDLSIDLQSKLLRVIQQRELVRIGGSKSIKLDIRIISSTNANLKEKIESGSFREDLYYRLSTIPIYIPSLRERRDDVPELVNYYLKYFGEQHGRTVYLSDRHMSMLASYNWPGNIRQLRNVIEYIVICSDGEHPHNINSLLHILGFNDGDNQINTQPTLEESMNIYEKNLILQAINKTGSIRKAAKLLGVDPSTISRKVKRHEIEPQEIQTTQHNRLQ